MVRDTLSGLQKKACVMNLGSTADTTAVATEWNGLLLLDDMLQVGLGLLQVHALRYIHQIQDHHTQNNTFLECVHSGVMQQAGSPR